MPGEVISGHADIEAECSSCHEMFNKSAQRQLCMDCHEDVAADISASRGFHGLHPDASTDKCASCHTDHEGRNAEVVILDQDSFDHDFTDFAISGAHLEAECSDCHAADMKFREAPSDCVDCHREESPHEDTMGDDCGSCHQPSEWAMEVRHTPRPWPSTGSACLIVTKPNFPGTTNTLRQHTATPSGTNAKLPNPTDWHDQLRSCANDFPQEHASRRLHSEDPFDDEMDMA